MSKKTLNVKCQSMSNYVKEFCLVKAYKKKIFRIELFEKCEC